MWRKRRDEGNSKGNNVTKCDAHDAANETENDGLEEELEENIARRGADGFTDADFAGALRDGDKHDIHDADAANDERNGGN